MLWRPRAQLGARTRRTASEAVLGGYEKNSKDRGLGCKVEGVGSLLLQPTLQVKLCTGLQLGISVCIGYYPNSCGNVHETWRVAHTNDFKIFSSLDL